MSDWGKKITVTSEQINQWANEMPAPEPLPSLDELMEQAVKYGRPNLFCYDDKTWSCTIEMWVNVENATFKVRSDFNHKSPKSAVTQALSAAEKAFNQLGVRV